MKDKGLRVIINIIKMSKKWKISLQPWSIEKNSQREELEASPTRSAAKILDKSIKMRHKKSFIIDSKKKIVINLWPITCLHFMWNILTEILSEELYDRLEIQRLLLEDQKGCQRKLRLTRDQQNIH